MREREREGGVDRERGSIGEFFSQAGFWLKRGLGLIISTFWGCLILVDDTLIVIARANNRDY